MGVARRFPKELLEEEREDEEEGGFLLLRELELSLLESLALPPNFEE